jgi:hypothetical protein
VNVLRGLLFDNLGLKLVALVMALLVYLNVYTDRPASLLVSFPIQIVDLEDSLSLAGPLPGAVQAELKGTGKALIRMRLSEPMLRVSLAGVEPGRFERAISAADLPLADFPGVVVERVVGPRMLEMNLERKVSVRVPVAARLEGAGAAQLRDAQVWTVPRSVLVTGPESIVAALDSVVLEPVRLEGRRDSVRTQVRPAALPEWCVADPPVVVVTARLPGPGTR